ncbi:MAG: DNA-binding protein [Burkholderiales bacterium]|nr:DNA-binding protein [Burkholderiales bacterium]
MAETQLKSSARKAGRAQVFAASDHILKAGRRPTQATLRELLGGGSLQSINRYLAEWYEELGARLSATEPSFADVPAEAASLLQRLWQLARDGARHRAEDDHRAEEDQARNSLVANLTALETINRELVQGRRAADQMVADLRALLVRKEATVETERAESTGLREALARAALQIAALEAQLAESVERAQLRRRGRGRRAKSAKKSPQPSRFKGPRVRRSPRSNRQSRRASPVPNASRTKPRKRRARP